MTVWRTMRRAAPWLLGLFVIAQAAGVVPLLALHAADVFERAGTQFNLVKARAPATPLHHEHQGNGGDVRDECCAVHHHLAGVLPHALDAVAIVVCRSPDECARYRTGRDRNIQSPRPPPQAPVVSLKRCACRRPGARRLD